MIILHQIIKRFLGEVRHFPVSLINESLLKWSFLQQFLFDFLQFDLGLSSLLRSALFFFFVLIFFLFVLFLLIVIVGIVLALTKD